LALVLRLAQGLDDAEVAEENLAVFIEEDILGLDVAVDVFVLMDEIERLRDGGQP